MFTQEEWILRRIERTDWLHDYAQSCQDIEKELMSTLQVMDRPGTASNEQEGQVQKRQ